MASTSKKQQQKKAAGTDENRQAMNWLVWGGSLVTLLFWTTLNDPFNAPKSWILGVGGFWLLGWVGYHIKGALKNQVLLIGSALAAVYAFFFIVAWLFTDNKYIGFFGDYQRRTGLLSYLCLIIFLVATSI